MAPISSSVNRANAHPLSTQVKQGAKQQQPFEPAIQLERSDSAGISELRGAGESAQVRAVDLNQEALSLSRAALVARGYDQALRGSGEQFSFVQTTLGAVQQSQSVLHEMRGLAERGLSHELSAQERTQLNDEFGSLSHILSRVAARTRFQGERVLNRPVTHLSIEGEDVRLKSVRPETLGRQAQALTYSAVIAELSLLGGDDEQPGQDQLTLNGVQVRDSRPEDDQLSTQARAGSAIAKAAAINAHSAETGVEAVATPTVTDGASTALHGQLLGFTALGHKGPIQPTSLTGGEAMLINGARFEGFEVQAYDMDGALRAAINAQSAQTGVTASVGAHGELLLSALDGRNIHLVYEGAHEGRALEAQLGLMDGAGGSLVYAGRVSLSSSAPIEADFGAEVSESLGGVIGALSAMGPVVLGVDRAAALDAMSLTDPGRAQAALKSVQLAQVEVEGLFTELSGYQARLEGALSALSGQLPSRESAALRPRESLTGLDQARQLASETQAQLKLASRRALLGQANHDQAFCAELLDPSYHNITVEMTGVGPTSIF